MSIDIAKLITVLGEKGHTPAQIAEIVAYAMAPAPAYGMEATTLNARQLRNQRHYEAKKRLKASEKATEQDAKTSEASETVLTASETSEIKTPPRAPVHTRGENNLSRLVDTGLGVGVVGALKPDQQTDDWPTGNADAIAKLLVRTVASAWLDPQKSPDLVTTAGRIAAWKRAGASWEFDVLPVVTGLCANRRSAVASWKFFDAAMGRSIADNRQALEIPEAAPRMAARDPPRASFADQLGDERRRATEMTLKALSVANG